MCDVLVALGPATADGRTLFAKNSDRPPTERQVVEWSPSRVDHGVLKATHIEVAAFDAPTLGCVFSRPAWCWGAEHGVNTAGVAAGNTTVYTTLDPRHAPLGLTGMDLVRLALERAATAAEGVAVITSMIERYGQGGSGHDPDLVPNGRPYWNSFLIADPTGAFVVDTSGSEWAVEAVADVRAISNRTTIPSFDAAHRHPRQPVDRLVDPRWRASQRALERRPIGIAAIEQHLRSHDSCGEPGWSVCMHVDGVEATTASMVASLAPDGGSVLRVCIGNPCEHPYTEFTLADAPHLDLSTV
jgi:secernin